MAAVSMSVMVGQPVFGREPPYALLEPELVDTGAQDTVLPPEIFHEPLVAAYEAEGGIDLTHTVLQGDHSFSWTRIKLTTTVVGWFNASCD